MTTRAYRMGCPGYAVGECNCDGLPLSLEDISILRKVLSTAEAQLKKKPENDVRLYHSGLSWMVISKVEKMAWRLITYASCAPAIEAGGIG